MIRKITWTVNGVITLRPPEPTTMLSYQLIPTFKVLHSLSAHLLLITTKCFLPSLPDPILQSHTLPFFDCKTRTTLLPSQQGIQPLEPLQSCFSFPPPSFPTVWKGRAPVGCCCTSSLWFTTGHPLCPNTAPDAPLVRTAHSSEAHSKFQKKIWMHLIQCTAC